MSCLCSLVPSSENAEQIDEEVDEVEIKGERAEQRHLLGIGVGVFKTHTHLLDLLRVVGGKSHEDKHTKVTDYHGHHVVIEEQVHQRGDDDADEAHEEVFAKRGEVGLRRIANEGHGTECAGGDKEHLCYR